MVPLLKELKTQARHHPPSCPGSSHFKRVPLGPMSMLFYPISVVISNMHCISNLLPIRGWGKKHSSHCPKKGQAFSVPSPHRRPFRSGERQKKTKLCVRVRDAPDCRLILGILNATLATKIASIVWSFAKPLRPAPRKNRNKKSESRSIWGLSYLLTRRITLDRLRRKNPSAC